MTRIRWESLLAPLAAGFVVSACSRETGDESDNVVRKLVKAELDWAETYCTVCEYGSYYSSFEECVDAATNVPADAVVDCTAAWSEEHAATKDHFECLLAAETAYQMCEGEPSCFDGALFTCDDGGQVPLGAECDGIEDCSDGSDESPGCLNCIAIYESAIVLCPAVPEAEADALLEECGWYVYDYSYDGGGGGNAGRPRAEESTTLLRPHKIPHAPRLHRLSARLSGA